MMKNTTENDLKTIETELLALKSAQPIYDGQLKIYAYTSSLFQVYSSTGTAIRKVKVIFTADSYPTIVEMSLQLYDNASNMTFGYLDGSFGKWTTGNITTGEVLFNNTNDSYAPPGYRNYYGKIIVKSLSSGSLSYSVEDV